MRGPSDFQVSLGGLITKLGVIVNATALLALLDKAFRLHRSALVELLLSTYRKVFHFPFNILDTYASFSIPEAFRNYAVLYVVTYAIVRRTIRTAVVMDKQYEGLFPFQMRPKHYHIYARDYGSYSFLSTLAREAFLFVIWPSTLVRLVASPQLRFGMYIRESDGAAVNHYLNMRRVFVYQGLAVLLALSFIVAVATF